jgi:hypothetical protein
MRILPDSCFFCIYLHLSAFKGVLSCYDDRGSNLAGIDDWQLPIALGTLLR